MPWTPQRKPAPAASQPRDDIQRPHDSVVPRRRTACFKVSSAGPAMLTRVGAPSLCPPASCPSQAQAQAWAQISGRARHRAATAALHQLPSQRYPCILTDKR
ncbi:hypothetical protein ACJQWK_00524 [Exserohilum turcicum]